MSENATACATCRFRVLSSANIARCSREFRGAELPADESGCGFYEPTPISIDPDRARLRAELAGRALTGLLAAPRDAVDGEFGPPRNWPAEALTDECLRRADALLAELERTAP